MSDVDTLKLIDQLRFIRDYECKTDDEVKTVNEAIKRLSAKRKTGRWIEISRNGDNFLVRCSECGELELEDSYYCPNCGAKMGGGR